jgi:hypothetical protein
MRNRFATILAALALLLGGALISADLTQAAKANVKVGVIRCDVAGGLSFVFGSTRKLECVYSPSGDYPSERYTGEIDKYGVDIGYIESGVIIWAVMAPSHSVSPGALAGTYVGVSADVAAGAGLGANVLVGGGESVALQPLSFTGSKGINIAAGLSQVQLKAVN